MSEGMYWHWQNLNEDRRGEVKGSGFWHGRAWCKVTKNLSFHTEWHFKSNHCACEVRVGGENSTIGLSLALPPISLYGNVHYKPLRRFVDDWDSKVTGVRIFDWGVWFEWWHNDMGGWTNHGSKWKNAIRNRQFNFNIPDLILGRQKYSRQELETKQGVVAMPEGLYPISVTFDRSTWKRPRWFAKSRLGARIECLKPIGFPGKGENSWDCGDDALHSMYCDATNMAQAIARVTESVLRSREKYGSLNWKPTEASHD